ncbi:MAG TPA: GNAT family N-acetyltransferase [Solirubrobacteraceae bacterium]|nr:GNAT family N-acetyltransferase [Solirubrobacteraceae bacterium]
MIRRARVADAAAIARVHVASSQFAYAEILPGERIAAMSVEEKRAEWQELLDDGGVVWVAEVEGSVVGFTSLEREHLTSLYVDPIAQGAGVGTALLAEAQRAGARTLDVLDDSGQARMFYEGRGWTDAGESALHWGLPTRRYVR